MLKGGVVGLGKMGISHASILGAHPDVNLIAVCDTNSLVIEGFKKYTQTRVYTDYDKMLEKEHLDFLFIVTPTRFHFDMVKKALEKDIHVFCEKPFTLTAAEGDELKRLANIKRLVNQVGFHNHFIGTFRELKRLLKLNIIGDILHFTGEAYGPVVLKEKSSTWRSKPAEGGGCLNDYASHVLNLIQEIIGRPVCVNGCLIKKMYSAEVEDAVYALLTLDSGVSGILSVNWSDETYRKMSTSLMLQGKNGKIICDATEIKIFLKKPVEGFDKGWTMKYITDFALPVNFYLRGEEYSAQIDHFIESIIENKANIYNTFEEAAYTDQVVEMIIKSVNK